MFFTNVYTSSEHVGNASTSNDGFVTIITSERSKRLLDITCKRKCPMSKGIAKASSCGK